MADVRPLEALRYDPARVALQDVTAPPYDVIDEALREELLGRSPYNVVAIDLPRGDDPYAAAARTMEEWREEGVLVSDGEPALWALTQTYRAPDGSEHERHAVLARVRVEEYGAGRVRPHERTQPGPKQDRLDLTRATKHNLSPIFSLATRDPWPLVAGATEGEPFGEVTDEDGTHHRLWRVADPEAHAAVAQELEQAELLIADGHHRYETARTYLEETGGDSGPAAFTLMALTGLEDPGLTVFPTHRLLSGFAEDPEKQLRLREGLLEVFDVEEVPGGDLDPGGRDGPGVFGYMDAHHRKPFRLRLKDTGAQELDRLLGDRPEAYRRLDAVILEALVLKGIIGMTEEDIAAKRDIGYAKSIGDVESALDGPYDVAFVLRPTPVEQVREVAAAGETMPPKSTYFFPKLLSGLVFNPLG